VNAAPLNCLVHNVALRHVRFVRVRVDELPRSENRCGKQDGEFSFLGHVRTPAFWNEVQVGSREGRAIRKISLDSAVLRFILERLPINHLKPSVDRL